MFPSLLDAFRLRTLSSHSCVSPQRGPYTVLCMMKIEDMIVKERKGRENLSVVAFSQSVFRTEVNKTLNCALNSVWVLLPAKAAGNNFIITREVSVRFSDI